MNSVGQAAEEAQETLDTASENLAAFQSLVIDNTIYAACAGPWSPLPMRRATA